jgi:hypothetical protein
VAKPSDGPIFMGKTPVKPLLCIFGGDKWFWADNAGFQVFVMQGTTNGTFRDGCFFFSTLDIEEVGNLGYVEAAVAVSD